MKAMSLLRVMAITSILVSVGCGNPADDVPDATVESAKKGASTQSAGAEKYVTVAGSTIGFVGSKVTGSHEGGFKDFVGELSVVGGKVEGSHVKVVIQTPSLWADNDRLAGHLKSPDFFDVENHPTATFESTKIVRAGTGYMITGNLDLHGVKKSVTFPAQVTLGEKEIAVKADFSINRFDFDIKYPGRPDDLIREDVAISLDLKATPGASSLGS